MPTAIKITTLPYMGKHEDVITRKINKITRAIPFTELHDYELAQVGETLQTTTDPFVVLERKIEHLADILGCSETEAENVLFKRLKTTS